MKKFYLLAGVFTILSYNAQAYYQGAENYYREAPRYETRNVQYKAQPKYQQVEAPYIVETEYVEREVPRYRRMKTADSERYYEKKAYREIEVSNRIRPYIGFDAATTSVDFGKKVNNMWSKTDPDVVYPVKEKDLYDDSHIAGSVVLGAKFNRNFGIEAFYQVSNSKSDSKNGVRNETLPYGLGNISYNDQYKASIKYHAIGLDFQGYAPISQDFELLASLGLAQYYFESKGSLNQLETYRNAGFSDTEQDLTSWSSNNDTLGFRFGIGAQYNITSHIALRAMARYVMFNDDDFVKNLTEFSLGLRYMF